MPEVEKQYIKVFAHIKDKIDPHGLKRSALMSRTLNDAIGCGPQVIPISCGEGTQRVQWLGHVAIARYDEQNYQGWEQLGVPKAVETEDGMPLEMGAVIREVLKPDQHITVTPSLSD